MEPNQRTFKGAINEYRSLTALSAPEKAIVSRFRSEWGGIRMLDLGVGAGRTAHTFAGLTKEYVGVDYVPEMIEACRDVCAPYDNVRLETGDARDLSRFDDDDFDFVLFSLNGIDCVGHDGRLKVLSEVRRVLRPGGHFFFSTHNLDAFPVPPDEPHFGLRHPLHAVYYGGKAAWQAARLRWHHRNTDIEAVRAQDWAILETGDHAFGVSLYHVRLEFQFRQLAEAGFRVDSVYGMNGSQIEAGHVGDMPWVYFLCRPATSTPEAHPASDAA